MTASGGATAGLRWATLGGVLLTAVLLPFFLFQEPMDRLSVGAVSADLGPVGVGAVVAALLATDLVLPIPSSLVATMAGYLLGPIAGTFAVWIGLSCGAIAGYALGRTVEPLAERLVGRDQLERAEGLARRHGPWVLALCRPVPVLAEATVVLAGLHRVEPRTFAWLVGSSNLGIALTYAVVGASAPEGAATGWVVGGAVIVPLLAAAIVRGLRR